MTITLPLSPLTLDAVQAEALRAHLKHGANSLINPEMSLVRKMAALVEEVGEVGRALTYDGDQGEEHLVKELIQVASVALSWVESIEGARVRRTAPTPVVPGWMLGTVADAHQVLAETGRDPAERVELRQHDQYPGRAG